MDLLNIIDLCRKLFKKKLGLGLRFDGGCKAQELVQGLSVQYCLKISPSARAKDSWGSLSDGDEIVPISSK